MIDANIGHRCASQLSTRLTTPTANAPSTASSADGSRSMPTPANQATIPVTASATAVRTAAITWSRIGFLLFGWLRGSGRQVEQAAVPNRFDRFRLQGVDAALHHHLHQPDPVQVAARFDPVVRVLEAWVVVVEPGGHMNTVSQTWHVKTTATTSRRSFSIRSASTV